MERKLASIQKVESIRPIVGADKIVCATILGWECVVHKDEFNEGDVGVYFEVDSILPDRPDFEFMRPRKFKVKTAKFKKQISQGLFMPLSILPPGRWRIGDDVTKVLGITKHDPQAVLEETTQKASANKIEKFFMQFGFLRSVKEFFFPKERYNFPAFISKTDEDRIQLFPDICEKYKNLTFIATEKLDGCSATYFLVKNKKRMFWFQPKYFYGVCSRNFRLSPKRQNNCWWGMSNKYNIKHVLEDLISDNEFVAIQGEIIGEGVQGNKYNIKGNQLYVFNLIYPDNKVDSITGQEILKKYGLSYVPILSTDWKLPNSIPEAVDLAKGKSVVNTNVLREGLVIRNYELPFGLVISFKIINPEFLLKNDE